ncbi:SusD/RagB family nutrient-binding outer membrane lipoprotein [Chitinophaga qingshengii]|uniref:SusD/RagB family nutrient-binding outer membrane lipoprotein n=2 Tax=Chitinophaga qingshengii TaxID=1569794 RepID=A0ABR7TS16_9BACT|nr:SusD/RagB family nutrient-binding outer membrane lipoprotein [Chitinophaga qingshengii]
MRNMRKYGAYLLLIIITGMFTACDKNFEDINKSVDFVSDPTPDFMLPAIELYMLDNTYYTQGDFVGAFVMHVTNRKAYSSLTMPGGYQGYHFEWAYENPFKNVVDLIARCGKDTAYANYRHIGRIIKAYVAHQLTDLYGDVPYFEAGKGYMDRLFTPRYDAQQQIYEDMFRELEDASRALDSARKVPTAADIVYKGDLSKWRRFANSLMLRLGLRIMKADPVNGKKWIEKAVAGGLLRNNDDNFVVKYLPNASTGGTTNPTANGQAHIFIRYPDNYRLTSPFVNFLKDRKDPRIAAYCMLPASRTTYAAGDKSPAKQKGWPPYGDRSEDPPYLGIPSADRLKYSVSNISTFGRYDAPFIHLSYAQVQLQLAECAVRGIVPGDAKSCYEKGVRAAMDQLKIYGAEAVITTAQADAYLLENPYNPASMEEALEMINTQYWIETHYNWYETFANMRRSGYPKLYEKLDLTIPANSGAILPRRLTYQADEIAINPHVQEAIKRQGPDVTSTRVWWDKP